MKLWYIAFLISVHSLTTHAITYFFAHGLAATGNQGTWYKKEYCREKDYYLMDEGALITFDFPDARQGVVPVNYTQTSFGQYNELVRLEEAYSFASNSCNESIVAFGLSRGGAALCNFLALSPCKEVKGVVIESAYDSIQSIADNLTKRFFVSWIPGVNRLVHATFSYIFMNYDTQSHQPIELVHYIRKDLPMLFICSQEDQLVPAASTRRLYQRLKETGHNHVYLFTAEHGRHAKILVGKDKEPYRNVVHAFYKKYDMPHNPAFAQDGEAFLSKCQP